MARIQLERLPNPPKQYDPQHMAAVVRALQLALQRADYAPQTEAIRLQAQSWIGL